MTPIASIPARWSWLKMFDRSAAHAQHAARFGKDPTAAMRLGIAGHAAALEPHRLRVYEGTRRGKAWDAYQASQPADAVICSPTEYERAIGMAAALRRADAERTDAHGRPLPLLFGAGVIREELIEWSHDGRAATSRPDARLPGKWIADLKCARTGDPAWFARDATRQAYPSQLVMYDRADAYVRTGDRRAISCDLYSIVVEPFAPYVVTTYRLTASAYTFGERKLDAWWSLLAQHEAMDANAIALGEEPPPWPGYALSVTDLEIDDMPFPEILGGDDNNATADGAPEAIDWESDL